MNASPPSNDATQEPASQHAADSIDSLLAKLRSRDFTAGVVGMGYVGLPLAGALHASGARVLGFDTDPDKVVKLERGEPYLKHLGDAFADSLAQSDRFGATVDFERLAEADAICVCVPTPIGPHHEPDLSYVERSGEAIGRSLRHGQLVVLESTTYPGTTRDEFRRSIERGARRAGRTAPTLGRDWFLAFSPERENPGSDHTTASIPKLVGGVDEASTTLAEALYASAVAQVVPVSSAEVAEAAKLLENVFRAVNIALVNELKVLLTEMNVDVWEVVRAASTKPFGFMPFFPGPGLGGHCIPIDPFYLAWKAKEVGRPTRFIELAGHVNHAMPAYVVERLQLGLNDHKKPVNGSRVLIVGLAYKANVDDVRESPSFEIIALLERLGARVTYHDPYVPRTWPMRRHDLGMTSTGLTPESVAGADAVVISTAHETVDYGLIAEHAKLVVDTRDAMRPFAEGMGDRLIRA